MTTPRQPRHGCSPADDQRLTAFLDRARSYATAARDELARLSALRPAQRRARWQQGAAASLARWFGPYHPARARQVARVFTEAWQRLHHGFPAGGRRRAMRIRCWAAAGSRCEHRKSLLANASIFGTIRVCPLLLSKAPADGGQTLLHEVLHHLHRVDDQRAPECGKGKAVRCYGEGALALVAAGKFTRAVHNNDNYAGYARALVDGQTRAHTSRTQGNTAMTQRPNSAQAHDNHDAGSCGCAGKGGGCGCASCQGSSHGGAAHDLDADAFGDGDFNAEDGGEDDGDLTLGRPRNAMDDDAEDLDDEALDADADDDDDDDDEALDDDDEALDDDDEALDDDDEALDALDDDDEALDDDDEAFDDDDEALEALDDDDEALDDDDEALEALDDDDDEALDAFDEESFDLDDLDDGDDDAEDGQFDAWTRVPTANRFIKNLKLRDVGSLTSELPANWRAQLEAAVNEAESWVSAAISAIDGIWNGRTRRARKREFKKHRAFSFWFGTSIVTIRQIRILRRRIHKMGRFFHQRRLNFTVNQRQHKSKSHGCFTKKNGSFNIALTVAPVIYLCPTFWTQSTATSRVRTIVHELTHRLLQPLALVTIPTGIFTHPWVNGRPVNTDTDVSGAEVLAHNRAMASRRSPVNWAFCFQEIGTRVRPTRATIRNEP